jgi:hypothetical protein
MSRQELRWYLFHAVFYSVSRDNQDLSRKERRNLARAHAAAEWRRGRQR